MKIHKFDSIPSTNSALLELSKKSAKSWTVFWTSNQTSGRGYSGNSWESEKNQNIALSVLIKSDLGYEELIGFNQWVSTVLQRYLSQYSDKVFVKWPNDIIINSKKVCGVLIETHRSKNELNIVLGIGLNVNQTDFEQFPKASSLAKESHRKYDLEEILSGLLTELENSYEDVEKRDWKKISEDYHAHLFRLNQLSQFKSGEEIFEGIIRGVDAQGSLEIEIENQQLKKFQHKEIELIY